MGFFDGFKFGSNKSISVIITNTQNNIFNIYGCKNPSDSQKMKASVYLCIAGIALLNELSINSNNDAMKNMINKIVNETRELTKPLSMKVSDLANDKEDLQLILSGFEIQLDTDTRVNGLGAFEALYLSKVERLINDILAHNGGDFGCAGYAAYVVANGIFGADKAHDNFIQVGNEIQLFRSKLVDLF